MADLVDPLSAVDKTLDWVGPALCTANPAGLYIAGFIEEGMKRKVQYPLLPGTIPESNQSGFSRTVRHQDCVNPLRTYSRIVSYMGGSEKIMDISGVGSGALAALLYGIAANNYHRNNVPNSSEHKYRWLTYSSLTRVCKHTNRIDYQVLNQYLPRLARDLPEREDSLEGVYWGR